MTIQDHGRARLPATAIRAPNAVRHTMSTGWEPEGSPIAIPAPTAVTAAATMSAAVSGPRAGAVARRRSPTTSDRPGMGDDEAL